MSLGSKLKKLRKQKNLTQVQVADALGFSRSVYSQYERNEREPSLKRLVSISRFFMVSLDYICDNSDRLLIDVTQIDEEDKTLIMNILRKY